MLINLRATARLSHTVTREQAGLPLGMSLPSPDKSTAGPWGGLTSVL